ncbi:PREDICTED: uncharacterized protein LOC101310682 [Fragaria vesca subsp. vesca]|uniref:uncharacterized protein LOC101310682 n=1 Tax=Fragaria vesca subsp. vesca TaxID=101020 RepID=UPI0002C36009|nr:PREDICTED: uncharacterized protein LOC101310682 [Fragaria vesca subsp. vesca]
MAQLLINLSLPSPTSFQSTRHLPTTRSRQNEAAQEWSSLLHNLKSHGRFSCLFSGNRREDQARKALEGALGGKRDEFEKWDKEIKKREEVGGGSSGGGGGWFGWGRRFGWSNGDDFWQEAQQASLAVLGILVMYLIVVKGELMLAVVFNPLLYALRGARNSFTFVTNKILRRTDAHADFDSISKKEAYSRVSAKDSVIRKWGSE